MGLKRVTAYVESVYPADDARSFEELKAATVTGYRDGVATQGGTLASMAITGASQDPDPEPVAEDVPPPVEPGPVD